MQPHTTHSNKRRRWKIESITFWGNVKQFANVHGVGLFFIHFEWHGIQITLTFPLEIIALNGHSQRMRFKLTLTTEQASDGKHRTCDDTSIEMEQRAEIVDFFFAATNHRKTWKCIQYETDRRDGRYVERMIPFEYKYIARAGAGVDNHFLH